MRRLFSYTAYGIIERRPYPQPSKKKRAEALFIISIPVFDEPS